MNEQIVRHRANAIPPLTEEQRAQVRELAALPDETIDFSDAPELTDEQVERMSRGPRGQVYQPRKQQITAHVDQDVLTWLESKGENLEVQLNRILRREMTSQAEHGGTAESHGHIAA